MWDASVRAGALIILLTIVGITGLLAEDVYTSEPDAEALVEDVLAENRDFDTIQGTRTTEIEIQVVGQDEPRYTMLTEDVWMSPPDKKRSEIIATEGHSTFSGGDIRVYNNTVRQWYWEDDERMVVDDEWEIGSHVEEFNASVFEQYEVEYQETDSIADRETYVVEITPAENTSVQAALTLQFDDEEFDIKTAGDRTQSGNISYSTTWWIDTETNYPIKEQVKTEHRNPEQTPTSRESRVRTVQYEDITFDSEVPDETFILDPPEGTTIAESAENLNIETLDEADEVAPFTVPEPPVSDRFELVWVNGWEFMDNHHVLLHYRDADSDSEDDQITFMFTDFPSNHTEDDVIRENVGELNATAYQKGGGDTLVYYCGEIRYEIQVQSHSQDNIEFAADVAESMECP